MKSKRCRSEVEARSKRGRSEVEVRSKRGRSEVEARSKRLWVLCGCCGLGAVDAVGAVGACRRSVGVLRAVWGCGARGCWAGAK